MPKGNDVSGLRKRLEFIGGGWIDRYVPEQKVEMEVSGSDLEEATPEYHLDALTTGGQTKALKTKVKEKAEEKEKPDRSVVLLVVGLAAIITVVIWIFFFLCLVIDQQSVADKLLDYAMRITVGLFVAMFAAIGVRYEFIKLS